MLQTSLRNLFIVVALGLFFSLSISYAAPSGLIPCGNTVSAGKTTDACKWNDVITLVTTIINFLIFKIAAPLGAIMFAYAGFLYITNGGNESKIKQAHDVFLYVFWGLVVALAAWLIINFVLEFFLGTGSTFSFLSV